MSPLSAETWNNKIRGEEWVAQESEKFHRLKHKLVDVRVFLCYYSLMSEQSPHRPYDPDVLARLTDYMLENGPVISPPPPLPEAPRVRANRGEHFIESLTSSSVAVGGLFKVFTKDGRLERAQNKTDRLQERVDLVQNIGHHMLNPRTPGLKPEKAAKESIGWRGTYKTRISEERPVDPNDFTKIGAIILKKPVKDEVTNPNRPKTISERLAARTLSRKMDKKHDALNKAAWLKKSYDLPGAIGRDRLPHSESSRIRRINNRAARLERKAARAHKKFTKVTESKNLRGSLARFRLNRATKKVARMTERRSSKP